MIVWQSSLKQNDLQKEGLRIIEVHDLYWINIYCLLLAFKMIIPVREKRGKFCMRKIQNERKRRVSFFRRDRISPVVFRSVYIWQFHIKPKKVNKMQYCRYHRATAFFITIETFCYHWKIKYLLNWIIKHHLRFSHFKQHMRSFLIFVYEGIKSDWWKNKAESLPRRKVETISNFKPFWYFRNVRIQTVAVHGQEQKKALSPRKKNSVDIFFRFFL